MRSFLYGASTVVGGTSAVAPLYAGLFASFGSKLGFVTPELYLNSACFHDVTHGDNGAFRGRAGADPCTGLGSPIGEILEERIQPATTHASRIREVMAENAQLRALIAGWQASATGSVPPLSVTRPSAGSIFQGYSLELRPRLAPPGAAIDARSIVYGVLNISSGDDPIKTDARALSDFGFSSQANFQGLTSRIDRALLASGASYNQFVDPNAVMNCKNVGDLITQVRLALAS
jgi:hypothetical protein